MLEIKIGCDPELVLFDKVLDKIVPAVGLVEGTKDKPFMFPNGGMMQLDGLALEFGTPPVKPVRDNFSRALKETLDYVRQYLLDKHGDRYELRCGSIVDFSDDIADDDPSLAIGCDPQFHLPRDYNQGLELIHTGSTNNPAKIPLGGHIHFGLGRNLSSQLAEDSAKSLLKAYPMCVIVSEGRPALFGNERVDVMGILGLNAVRIKSYGVEYRNYSSAWLACPTFADTLANFYLIACQGLLGNTQHSLDYDGWEKFCDRISSLRSNELYQLAY